MAICGFDVAAGGVGRPVDADATSVGSAEGSEFCAGCTRVAKAIPCAGWLGSAVATGWLATCGFDVPAGGIGCPAEVDAISAGCVEGCTRVAKTISCAGWFGPAVDTGWLATCGFDVPAGGVGRPAEVDAISAGSVEGCTRVAKAISCASWLDPAVDTG